ncbi:MAG: STAS domain-containing protein [Sedimentisphaerales bacterium]|nr:STAS domain-containing protein [Sedimentisphaerales bacterium]
MTIKNDSDGIIIVQLPSEPNIRAELDTLMEVLAAGADNDVIIDFSDVDIMTSMSLSGFLKVREIVMEAGKRLIFTNAAALTKDIFTVTCFDGIFEFVDDQAEALKMLQQEHQHTNLTL